MCLKFWLEYMEQLSEESGKLMAAGRLGRETRTQTTHESVVRWPFPQLVLDPETARHLEPCSRYRQIELQRSPWILAWRQRKSAPGSQRDDKMPYFYSFFTFPTPPAPRQSCHDGGGLAGTKRESPYLWPEKLWFLSFFSSVFLLLCPGAERPGPFSFF